MKLLGVLVVLVLLGGVGVAQAAAPDPVPGRGLYFVNLASNTDGTETWFRYELRSGGAPAVSNVEIEACTQRLLKTIVQTPDGVAVEVREGKIKIETPLMGALESKTIILVMAGSGWAATPTSYTLKAGEIVVNGETYGPHCTPTAVTLTTFKAGAASTLGRIMAGLSEWWTRMFGTEVHASTFQSPIGKPPAVTRRPLPTPALFTSPVVRAAAPTGAAPMQDPLCPGFEPNNTLGTATRLTPTVGFLDSQKLSTPEQDFGDYILLERTPGYTQTLMIQGGYHVYPVVILRYIDGGGVLRQWRVIGNGKTDVITDSWVFPLPYDLYAEVWMTGKEAGCMFYYLDYWQTPNRTLWLPMILRN